MTKKIAAAGAVLALLFTMCACGQGVTVDTGAPESTAQTEAETTEPETAEAAPAAEPAEAGTAEAEDKTPDGSGIADVTGSMTGNPEDTKTGTGDASNTGTTGSEKTGSGGSGTETGSTGGGTKTEASQPADLSGTVSGTGIRISSLFSVSMPNPDTGADVTDCAAIEIKNDSGRFIATADITVVLKTGYELKFKVTDFPAGATLWAFDLNNTVISNRPTYSSAAAAVTYDDGSPVPAAVTASANGTSVTISNTTGSALKGMTASFHTNMNGILIGGTVYTCTVPDIPANGSVTIDVSECYLGYAELVRLAK